jgi:cation diffusion facilitator CzcD-associated flavoprotein CzcO
MRRDPEVVVVGAGPQGLAVAAHLRHAGVETLVVGEPMGFWKRHMPAGMFLRSLPRASSISDPTGSYRLARFEALRGASSTPIPLEHFIEYGTWFQHEVVPEIDRRRVKLIERSDRGFRLAVDDGDRIETRRVIVAAGIDRFAFTPPQFRSVPASAASHTFMHPDLRRFAGQRVVVVGGGQSALESAALLHESDAEVEVLVRANRVRWLKELPIEGRSTALRRMGRILKPPTGVGPPGLDWVVGVPELYRSLPESLRRYVSWRSIPPAGADWVKPRLRDVPIRLGREVSRVERSNGRVALRLDDGTERVVDHVILGSGYAPDISRYEFLSASVLDRISQVGGYPVLGAGFESSVSGLHFVGAVAAHSYGPIMRFVVGSGVTGREVTRHVTGRSPALLDTAW